MLAHLMLSAVLVGGAVGVSEERGRQYVLAWASPAAEASPGQRALEAQVDRQLRAELKRRGATVLDQCGAAGAIVLKPSLEILPRGLTLRLVGLRQGDWAVLGAVSTKVAGSDRSAQLEALVRRTCDEADRL